MIRFSLLLSLFLLVASLQAHVAVKQVQADPRPITPNDCLSFALADTKTLPLEEQRYSARYLSLHNFTPDERVLFLQTLNFDYNSLSRTRGIYFLTPVPGSNLSVARFDLESIGMSPEAWETLASRGSGPVRISTKTDQPEPYYSITKQTEQKTTTKRRQMKDAQGRLLFYNAGQPNETPAYEDYQESASTIIGPPWLDPVTVGALALATKSAYPILRADWFHANAMITPAYSEILGFKTLKDFQNFVRYTDGYTDRSVKGIVVDSKQVALHNRALLVSPTQNSVLGSWYWESSDYLQSANQANLLKDLLNTKRDAGEIISNGPNGLLFYLLVNGKNEIIDSADPKVATDQNTPWRYKEVYSAISCIGCHTSGMHDINDEVRALSKPPGNLQIPIKEKDKARQVADLFYSIDIADPLKLTNESYAMRVAQATRGLTPQKNAAAFTKYFVDFLQKPITLEMAAREVGCDPAELKKLIIATKAPSPDPTLMQLVAGREVRRDMWEDGGFQQAATLIFQLHRVKQ